MTNHEVLEKFLDIQRDTMFSVSKKLESVRTIFNDSDKTSFWNYALASNDLDDEELMRIEEKMESLDRKPAVYFEHSEALVTLEQRLTQKRYQVHNDDSWMFYEDAAMNDRGFNQVKHVTSLEELGIWLETLDRSYVADDPKNPYGKLGSYLWLADRAWKENNALGIFEYFVAFKENEPVAVATLTFQEKLAYISNVGSVPQVRGEGFGKLITLYCVNEAKNRGSEEICLATEENTYPNEFYKRIGFKTRFTARCYVKS